MSRRFWSTVLPAATVVALVVAACGGGDGEPTTARPSPTALATASVVAQPARYEAPHSKPGPAVDRILFKSFHVDRAAAEFEAGNMDAYIFSLKTAAAQALRNKEGVRLDEAPATSVSIVLNPAPAPEGQLNPFSIKEIRQAVQYLVNRNAIASDIYQGMALPMVTHLSPTDFDFLTIFDIAKEVDYRYDPELARSIIQREMTRAGAELVDGRWEFQGRPVRLKFIVRVEDERRDVGELLRAELEKAGFVVAPTYQQFAPAVLAVYSSDPQSFGWHLYTEGWGRGAPQRYDFGTINQMAAPWQGNMPGWRETGFWQYENAELDDLGQRLFTGDFRDLEERNQIYRRMTEIALDESIRVWVATVQNSFPFDADIRGITTDLVSGPKTQRTVRNAYIPDKDQLTLGNLWVWTERTTWNPVGGFGDLYSNDIWRNLVDPAVANHPFTGLPVAFRADFTVETAGPDGRLPVPEGAVLWDPDADVWAPAKAQSAKSKVTFDFSRYFNSNWHHGQPISMADVLYSIAQSYELAFDKEKSRIEFALGVTTRPFLETFRGYRLVGNNRLEVYVDFWHFEESQIAGYATPGGLSMPWELLAAMDDLVFQQRRAAYSDTASFRYDVPWLSLVLKRDAGLVARTLRTFLREDRIPESIFTVGNRSLVSPAEAEARYQASLDWFDKFGMLVISNGPFFLSRYDIEAQFAQIEAFRDPTYPYKPGDWFLGDAPRLEIGRVERGDLRVGEEAKVSLEVTGPGVLGVRYVLFDPAAGKVLEVGEGQPSGPGRLTVTLSGATTAQLEPGLYQLFLAAFSDEIASLVERQVDLEVLP
ncbi:MAG: ABC transporter substrate-binding protein [Dehalococcoidia bacterium]